MTLERIITHSKEIGENCFRFFLDYPMGRYIPKWKIFRAFTNENRTIAEHISSTMAWQNTEIHNLLDVGTGDGLVLANLLTLSSKHLNKVILVDPNSDLLFEARKHLSSNTTTVELEVHNDDISNLIPSVFQGIDIVLIVHVLYLVPTSDFEKIINSLPSNLPVLIITDNEDSLFPKCWEITAPKYFERSQNINALLRNLPQNEFSVKTSTFKTFLKNPLMIERPELKDSILSLICYVDYENLGDEKKKRILELLKQNSIEDLIYCDSICYEVVKTTNIS
jgi:SAM-dependent methyltransferase